MSVKGVTVLLTLSAAWRASAEPDGGVVVSTYVGLSKKAIGTA
jgi:hypothetical protein